MRAITIASLGSCFILMMAADGRLCVCGPSPRRAYKLGKKRWSYNQCELVLQEQGGSKVLTVKEAASVTQTSSDSSKVRVFASRRQRTTLCDYSKQKAFPLCMLGLAGQLCCVLRDPQQRAQAACGGICGV